MKNTVSTPGDTFMRFRTALILFAGATLAFAQAPQAPLSISSLGPVGKVRGINRSGLIVGYTVGDDRVHGFILQNGTVEEIEVPNSIQTLAYGVESNGRVVGCYYRNDHGGAHGLLYFHGAVTTVDFPGATSTIARGINDPQRIVGEFRDEAGQVHGFLYDKNSFTQVDMTGAVSTTLEGINNPGDMVGHFTDVNGHEHGFIQYTSGSKRIIDVPFLGVTDTFLYGINSSGVIVGSYIDDTGTHGFLDVNGVFTFVDAPGTPPGIGTLVPGINDNGQVVISGATAGLGEPAS
jgi:uncharacterized membrane protein